jgi:hypothetical protein
MYHCGFVLSSCQGILQSAAQAAAAELALPGGCAVFPMQERFVQGLAIAGSALYGSAIIRWKNSIASGPSHSRYPKTEKTSFPFLSIRNFAGWARTR